MSLLRTAASFVVRQSVLLVLILVGILVAQPTYRWIRAQVDAYDQRAHEIVQLRDMDRAAATVLEAATQQAQARARALEKSSIDRVETRLVEIRQEIGRIDATPVPDVVKIGWRGVKVDTDALGHRARMEVDRTVLVRERDFLEALLSYRRKLELRVSSKAQLERLLQDHVKAYAALDVIKAMQDANNKELKKAQDALDSVSFLQERHLYFLERKKRLDARNGLDATRAALEKARKQLYDENQAAHYRYQDGVADLAKAATPGSAPSLNLAQIDIGDTDTVRSMRIRIAELEAKQSDATGEAIAAVKSIAQDVPGALPQALGILAAMLLVPIGLKALAFYVFARLPSAARAAPIVPASSRGLALAGEASGVSASTDASCSIRLDETRELLVQPEYLTSLPTAADVRTRWVLDARHPLTSVTAQLYGLTWVRVAAPVQVNLAARRLEMGELAVVDVPEGTVLACLPRHIVGVVQTRARPLQVTVRWRLSSLHAWLTMRLRHVLFHGPVQLILEGSRGVRIEPATSSRAVNRDIVIGFNGNLAFHAVRSETFFAYLRGKQPLMHDRFSENAGEYVYQTRPGASSDAPGSRRDYGRMTDYVLKVFGI